MNKIFFLYGNNWTDISKHVSEILSSISSTSTAPIEINKIELQSHDEVDNFLKQEFTMSLFPSNTLQEIYLSSWFLNYPEEKLVRFCDLLKNISKHKTVALILCIEKYNKQVKAKVLDSLMYKEIEKIAEVKEFVKLMFWQDEQIKQKIILLAKSYDLVFENNALNLFFDCFKENLDNLDQELQKIKIYLLPSNIITQSVVTNLYVNSCNIDELYKTLVNMEYASIASLVQMITKLKSPLYLIASLQNKLRQAFNIKLLLESKNSISQISKLAGISFYKVESECNTLKKVSSSYLKSIINILSNIEFKVKSGFLVEHSAIDLLILNASV